MKQKSVKITHDGRTKLRLLIKDKGLRQPYTCGTKHRMLQVFAVTFQHLTTEEARRFLWLYLHSAVIERGRGRALGSRSGFTHSLLLMLLLRHRPADLG